MSIWWLMMHRSLASFVAMYMNLQVMDQVFKRRHSLAVWVVYFGLKGVLSSFFDTAVYLGMYGSLLENARFLFLSVTAVLSYAVLYYTWHTDILRVGVIALASDLLSGVSLVLGTYVNNQLQGRSWNATFIDMGLGGTLIACLFALLLFATLLHLSKPLLRRLAAVQMRHRWIWAGGIILLISTLTLSELKDMVTFTVTQFVVVGAILTMGMACAVYFALAIRRETGIRRIYRQQMEIQEAYHLSLDTQAKELDAQRKSLDRIEKRLAGIDQGAIEGAQAYLDRMRNYLHTLQGGSYSDDPVLDAVLTVFARDLEASGCRVSFRTGPLQGCGGQAAEAAEILLRWVMREDPGKKLQEVEMQIFRRRNQLLCILQLIGSDLHRCPRNLLDRWDREGLCRLETTCGAEGQQIRVMMEVPA